MPTDQRTSEREKGLVDVGAFVVPDAQTTELIEPGKRSLYDPTPPPQATPGAAAVALQGRNRIDEGQRFLRVVAIGASQADRQRDALAITDQMPFAPALGAVCRIRAGLRSAIQRTHRTTVHDGA